jgi:hypothetical protein
MQEILKNNLVIICLTVITIAELIISKNFGGSIFLWILCGIYKYFSSIDK